jgi:hypothetical protein
VNILAELISGGKRWLKSGDNVYQLQRFFAALPSPSEIKLEHHEQVCIGLSIALESQPNIWHFARHYLNKGYPPFKRFLEKDSDENNPPPAKKSKQGPYSEFNFLICQNSFM